jgi:UDP-N-acetylmuramoyl-L-alanyl-D-glutamate--2,6-diaminopimelate ligase
MDIIRAVEAGCREAATPAPYHVVEDRAGAIHEALALAQPGDVVIIAGKGHEPYQIVGHRRIPFDDRRVARQALQALGYPGAATP